MLDKNDTEIPPVPEIPPEPIVQKPDADSVREQKLFANPDAKRRETLKQAIHSAIVFAVRVAGFSVIVLFVVRMWHMAAPGGYRWLAIDELQQIDHLLFSGALGGFLMRYLGDTVAKKVDHE